VANEVKALASETAQATSNIAAKISAMQARTKGAVASIEEISLVVQRINDYSNAIASAVEEQPATTNAMTRSISDASQSVVTIAQSIGEVAATADQTSGGALETKQAAAELNGLAEKLHKLVGQFKFTAQ